VTSSSNRFSILVDAMGGDFAPEEVIKGSLNAALSLEVDITLVGNADKIKEITQRYNFKLDNIKIVHSSQEIEMGESPSDVIRNKKDSSVYVGTKLLSEGRGDAFLSAGNTGAVMACSLLNNKRIEGILRPAIAVVIPLVDKRVVLIDAGANVDSKPGYLKQFAIMGKVYSENILGVSNPRVGLVNVGTEEKKGSEAVIKGYRMLKESRINFIGNIEGRDIFEGNADVVVCDGFVGNVLLKSIEGMANLFFGEVKKVLTANPLAKLAAVGLKKSFLNMKKKFDYEEYGGAQLLGVDGIVIIAHGSSKAKAITNAIRVAREGAKTNLVGKIRDEIKN